MVVTKSSSSIEILSTAQKRNGFHGKYLIACKSKNLQPLPEVKAKQRNIHVLDFHADRVKPLDWISICNAMYNDKTLKSLAVRLRKNNEFVFEELDTLKKAQTLVTAPPIYSKFLLTEFTKALQNLTTSSNMLETLVLEGLPLTGRYMTTVASGLTQNQSIKILNFSRCNIGDEACESLCETLKHLMNVETLNLSGCNLGVKGAEAVTNLVKYHKIQRFSDAWSQSLRYQNVDADSFSGLRKVLLNNNPDIGDGGVELLAEALKEDIFIKDIEMQRCGLTDEGAQHIINCLNINRTVLSFNISGNPEVSEHLHRHIVVHLGNVDPESSDSSDSKTSTKKLSKFKLLDKVKFLEDQLEMEIFRRKKMEELHEKLQHQNVELQKEITFQGSFRIPDGFTLVANNTIDKLLKENSEVNQVDTKPLRQRRKRRVLIPKKSISYTANRPSTARIDQVSKSETKIKSENVAQKKVFIERNIGDHSDDSSSMKSADILRMFARKTQSPVENIQEVKKSEDTEKDAGVLKIFAGQSQGDFTNHVINNSKEVQNQKLDNEANGTENHSSMSGAAILQLFAKQNRQSQEPDASNPPKNFDPRSLFTNSAKKVPQNSDADSDE